MTSIAAEKLLLPYYGEDSPKVVQTIVDHLGEKDGNWKWLGEGSFANVYWLHDKKKALKITRDRNDADASEIMRNKPDRSVVKVYDVFALPKQYTDLWGIVVEKLSPLSYKEGEAIANLYNLLWDLGIDQTPTMKHVKEFKERLENPDPKKHPIDKYIQEYYDKSGVTEEMIDRWETWAKVLDSRHIYWKDFKPANVMSRGRNMVISDLGYSKVPHQKIPELQVSET